MSNTNVELKMLAALQETAPVQDTKFRITRGAYRKAHLTAKIVSRLAGGGMECYGHQLASVDRLDNIVRDISFAKEQNTQAAFVRITPEAVKAAVDEAAAKGYGIVGWWHSHGTMSTFHSSWDRDNFLTILHSIAPQTMYRWEKGVHILNGNVLNVDGYKISGVKADGPISVLQRVQQDPFAFSMVVNDHEGRYLERITKTWDSLNKRFEVNAPVHPAFEIVDVDNDLVLDIPKMEWEISTSMIMEGHSYNEFEPPSNIEQYSALVDSFTTAALAHIKRGGKNSNVIKNMLASSEVPYKTLTPQSNGNASAANFTVTDEMKTKLTDAIATREYSQLRNPNTKYTRADLEALLVIQFMGDIVAHEKAEDDYDSLTVHTSRAQILNNAAKIAQDAAGTLSRYAMEPLTDYKKQHNYKYTTLIGNIIDHMSNGNNVHITDAIRRETTRPSSARSKTLFLKEDRIGIFNQILKDVYYMQIQKMKSQYNGNVLEFLTTFPKSFEVHDGQADEIIQKHLLTGRTTDFVPYADGQKSSSPKRHLAELIARYARPLIGIWRPS